MDTHVGRTLILRDDIVCMFKSKDGEESDNFRSILTVDNPSDAIKLHQVSEPVEVEKATSTIENLVASIPEGTLGLSAPQIGIFDRVFIAVLKDGVFAFVNPTSCPTRPHQFTSKEGCLSVPGESRMMTRWQDIKIKASAIYSIESAEQMELLPDLSKELHQGDAAIFQHELDHLEGLLITDKREDAKIPVSDSISSLLMETTVRGMQIRTEIRKKATLKKQLKKSRQKKVVTKMNPRKKAKLDKTLKAQDKRRKKRVEIEEYQKAVTSGIISFD